MKTYIQHIFFSCIFSLLVSASILFAPPQPGAFQPPPMSPQDMQAFDAEMQRLLEDPQALQKAVEDVEREMEENPDFKKFVEEMAAEMAEELKREGIDLDQLAPPPLPPAKPAEVPAPLPPVEAPKPAPPAVPAVSKKTIKEIHNILETIAEKLADIRQKTYDDKAFGKLFEPWQFHVDDIIYYANALMEDHLVKYLAEKEFEQLYESLKIFAKALEELEPKIESREYDVDEESPYSVLDIAPTSAFNDIEAAYNKKLLVHKKPAVIANQMKLEGRTTEEIDTAKKQAEKEIKSIEEAFSEIREYEQSKENLRKLLEYDVRTLVDTVDIKAQIKKILEKHDPEALKIAQEKEKEQAEARKKQDEAIRRMPPYAPPAFYFPPMAPYPGTGYGDYGTPYGPAPYTAPTTSAPIEQAVKLDETKKPPAAGKRPGIGYPPKPEEKKPTDVEKKELEEAKKKAAEESKEKGLKEEAVDPKVEATVKTFQDNLDAIEDKLSQDIIPGYNPVTLFKDIVKFKTWLETLKPRTWAASIGLGQSIPNDIKPIQKALIELTNSFNQLKKDIIRTLRDATTTQKSSIKKRISALFNEFERDILDKTTRVLTKTSIAANDDLFVDTQKINITHPDIQFILRGQNKAIASTAAKNENPGSIDVIKDFHDSYNALKNELVIAVVPPVPAAPAPTP